MQTRPRTKPLIALYSGLPPDSLRSDLAGFGSFGGRSYRSVPSWLCKEWSQGNACHDVWAHHLSELQSACAHAADGLGLRFLLRGLGIAGRTAPSCSKSWNARRAVCCFVLLCALCCFFGACEWSQEQMTEAFRLHLSLWCAVCAGFQQPGSAGQLLPRA